METLKTINFVIAVIFFVCYTYQFLYIPVPWLRKARPHGPAKDNRYAVLICARNEQRVIGDLIASLRGQTYSQGLLSIFVLADNCTDDTAMVARVAGANVYERFNQVQVGKGYALQELLEHLEQDYPQGFDGYFVFDADNILAPNYVEAMNRTFSDGHDIVTSFRNSKNYGDNWISAGYALWFLRESRYLNHARFLLGTSCAVSGTGFLFSRRVLEEPVAGLQLPGQNRPLHLLDKQLPDRRGHNGTKIHGISSFWSAARPGRAISRPETSWEVRLPSTGMRPGERGRVTRRPFSVGARPQSPGRGRASSRRVPVNRVPTWPRAMARGRRNRRVLPLAPQSMTGSGR